MQAIDFVVRTGMGAVERGQFPQGEAISRIGVPAGSEISINVRQIDLRGFTRVGNDLEIVLVDGRVILLDDYYVGGEAQPRLFISADGYLNEVALVEGSDGVLYAQYGPTEQWGKWSPSDDLIFVGDSQVVSAETYAAADNEVSMLGAGLLGGSGLGLLGGAAAVGGIAVVGGGGDGGPVAPTVDDTTVVIGGDGVGDDPSVTVTGTGEPGSDVVVTIGDETVSTTIDDDGEWETEFTGDDFPEDGEYDTVVVVTDPEGTVTELDGPTVVIDTTPPELEFTDGTQSVGDITNADDHADGVEIAGTGEPGASVTLTVEGASYDTTVAEDGTWALVVDTSVLGAGEYEAEISVVTVDDFGNSAVFVDTVVIDTVPNTIAIDTDTFEGDGVLNLVETRDGIQVTGSSVPGETVTVTLGGATQSAVVGADGHWSATFPEGTLAPGEYEAAVTVTSTDAAGNVNTVDAMLVVDTESFVSLSGQPITSDGIINATERGTDGVTLTGTTQPGSTVEVTMGNVTHLAQVDGSGNWSVTFGTAEVPSGETNVAITAVATDAAGNVSTTQGDLDIDTLVRNFALTGAPGGADGIVNADEADAGLTVTGTSEPGSTVIVQLGHATIAADVDAQGNWSATIPQTQITRGDYVATMTVTATDLAGNVDTITQQIDIDTEAGFLTLSQAPIEGDNVINHDESLDGVVIRGTATPGAVVEVSLGGVTHTTVADGSGIWQRLFTRGEIPADTDSAEIVATTTDDAGNTRTVTGSVGVDTVVENHGFAAAPIAGDGIINAAERGGVVEVSGTVEPGSVVNVSIGSVSRAASVAADGTWTAQFPPGSLPTGEDVLDVVVQSVDIHGNSDQLTTTVALDTLVNTLDSTGDPTGGDGVVNLAEAQAGLSLSGVVEAGSTVLVTVDGMAHQATVDARGNWSIDLPPDAVPAGQPSVDVEIAATDAAGNTASITQTIALDLAAPDAPMVEDYTRNLEGYSAISVALGDDDVSVYEVDHGVPGGRVGGNGVEVEAFGVEAFRFDPEIADGSHLIVHSVDDAGNSAGTYLVLDETSTSQVDLSNAGLGAFNIESVDLQFAEDSQLTITEAQITALSSNTDTLVIAGGSDDTVTIRDAQLVAGGSTRVNGQDYDAYSLGDATVLIDDDINVVI